jgi:hypothetical protein
MWRRCERSEFSCRSQPCQRYARNARCRQDVTRQIGTHPRRRHPCTELVVPRRRGFIRAWPPQAQSASDQRIDDARRARHFRDCSRGRRGGLRLPPVRLEHFHSQRERPRLRRHQRAYTDNLPSDLFAALVADRHYHRILPHLIRRGWLDGSVHLQRGETRKHALGRRRTGAHVVPAAGTDVGAFEDRRPAVRATARLSRRPLIYRTHVLLLTRCCVLPPCPSAADLPWTSRTQPAPACANPPRQ